MSFQKHEQNGLVWFTADALNAVPHGFSTRRGGVSPAPWDSLNLRPSQGMARRRCGKIITASLPRWD